MSTHIPHVFIDDLIARVDLIELIQGYIQLRKAGKDYQGLCPFHQEKSPSFSVVPGKQFYYCFGCGASGNAIDFLMSYEHLDFVAAVEQLASHLGLVVPREGHIESAHAAKAAAGQQTALQRMEQMAAFYQKQLRIHTKAAHARAYLYQKRGLSEDICERFEIGYAPPGWDAIVQAFVKQPTDQTELFALGMLAHSEEKQRYYDRFRDRVMFPIRNKRGQVIAFGGRVLDDSTPKYLNSPETEIFHKGRELYGLYEARKHTHTLTQLVVVEGYMDVVALAQHGFTQAVATLGTACSVNHIQTLFKMVPRVIFCFDGDNAGLAAAARALKTCLPVLQDGWHVGFVFLPNKHDPDSYVREHGLTGFEKQLQQSTPLSRFLFEHYAQGLDLATAEGRSRWVELLKEPFKALQAPLLRQMLLQNLADRTTMPLSLLSQILLEAISSTPIKPANTRSVQRQAAYSQRKRPVRLPKTLTLTERAIAILLQHPALLAENAPLLPINAARLLEHWRDDPMNQWLAALAMKPLDLGVEALQAELEAVFNALAAQNKRNERDEVLEKVGRLGLQGLSEEDKDALKILLNPHSSPLPKTGEGT